jgi:hypothetical protein
MLSLFKVRPPLSTTQRVNVELLMRRTIEAIGPEFARQSEIVHDVSVLQIDTSDPTTTLATALIAIADRFPPVRPTVEAQIVQKIDHGLPSTYHAAAEGEPALIEIQVDRLSDPLRSALELANQYSAHFWHASGQMESDQIHPNLTHLLPICCGFGILASDASFYDSQWSDGGWHGWSMSRTGYYNASEIGYATALMYRHRGDRSMRWLKAMRLDSRDAAKKANRYFSDCDQQHRPLLFDADRIPSTRSNPTDLAGWFAGDDENFALAAGFALQQIDRTSSLVTEAARQVATGTNPELVSIAIQLLGQSRPVTGDTQSLIENLIPSPNHAISIAALQAAESLNLPITRYRDPIAHLLDAYAEDSVLLINLVARQGHAFESFDTLVCRHLGEAIQYSNRAATGQLAECLKQISPDPSAAIRREIKDSEIQELALASVNEPNDRKG